MNCIPSQVLIINRLELVAPVNFISRYHAQWRPCCHLLQFCKTRTIHPISIMMNLLHSWKAELILFLTESYLSWAIVASNTLADMRSMNTDKVGSVACKNKRHLEPNINLMMANVGRKVYIVRRLITTRIFCHFLQSAELIAVQAGLNDRQDQELWSDIVMFLHRGFVQ